MPLWVAALIPKDKAIKIAGIALLAAFALFTLLFVAPMILILHIPMVNPDDGHVTFYKSAVNRVQSEFGLSISWRDVMALDAVLLKQDFSSSSSSRAYRSAKHFVREEEVYRERTCYRPSTEIVDGEEVEVQEPYDCSYWETVYYSRSLDEVIELLVSAGTLSPEQREDVRRYTVLDWTAIVEGAPPNSGGGGNPVYIPPGQYYWPVPGVETVTSNFGYRIHPITGEHKLHAGTDIGAPTGTLVAAAQSGVVTRAEYMGNAGNAIIVDHGGNIETRYYHLSAYSVRAGDTVQAGQKIGEVGNTGGSTGPHLHFEIRINGTPINPMLYF